jgi:cation:H+ antiporter
MYPLNLALYILAFIGLWYGSGLIVASIKRLAHKIQIPSFIFSFFVLGILTSIPEIAVGVNALSENHPEVFVGNLLGGVIVMFLLVIPLLAIINKRVRVKKHLSNKNLLVTLGIICSPALFALDKTITNTEGFILIALYITLFYIIRTRQDVLARIQRLVKKEQKDPKNSSILKLSIGIGVVFLMSRFIVDQTIAGAEFYGVSTFIVSLMILGLGTNLPEITLAIRSITSKAEDVALGDYLGSAAANTLLFGIFTLINNGNVVTEKSFLVTFLIIVFSLGMFFMMTRGKSTLTRKEGLALLSCYLAFITFEFLNIT